MPSSLTQQVVNLLAPVFRDEHDIRFLLEDAGFPPAEIPRLGTNAPQAYWRSVIGLVEQGIIPGEELAKRNVPTGLAAVLQQACKRRPGNRELAELLARASAPQSGSDWANVAGPLALGLLLGPAAIPLAAPIVAMRARSAPSPARLPPPTPPKPKILVLGAVPSNEPALRVNRELKKIRQTLARPEVKVRFEVEDHLSTEPGELLDLLERERPTVLHFAGHNAEGGALILERADGTAFPLKAAALARVLDVVNGSGPPIQAVVLNACASEAVAAELREKASVIVGTLAAIADAAAINFAGGFYDGLTRQESVAQSLNRGRAHVGLVDRTAGPVKQRWVGAGAESGTGLRPDPFDPDNIVAWPEQGLDKLYVPARPATA